MHRGMGARDGRAARRVQWAKTQLLKSFINAPNMDEKTLLWQTLIHLAFILSAVSIAYIDKTMSHPQATH